MSRGKTGSAGVLTATFATAVTLMDVERSAYVEHQIQANIIDSKTVINIIQAKRRPFCVGSSPNKCQKDATFSAKTDELASGPISKSFDLPVGGSLMREYLMFVLSQESSLVTKLSVKSQVRFKHESRSRMFLMMVSVIMQRSRAGSQKFPSFSGTNHINSQKIYQSNRENFKMIYL